MEILVSLEVWPRNPWGHNADPGIPSLQEGEDVRRMSMLMPPSPAVTGGLPGSLAVIYAQPVPKQGRVGLFYGRGLS